MYVALKFTNIICISFKILKNHGFFLYIIWLTCRHHNICNINMLCLHTYVLIYTILNYNDNRKRVQQTCSTKKKGLVWPHSSFIMCLFFFYAGIISTKKNYSFLLSTKCFPFQWTTQKKKKV